MRHEQDKRPLTQAELLTFAECLEGVAKRIREQQPVHRKGALRIDFDYELKTVRIHGDILLQLIERPVAATIHHPRTQKVTAAKIEVKQAVLGICERHGLTFVESVQACTDAIAMLARDALRAERHPDDHEKGADEP